MFMTPFLDKQHSISVHVFGIISSICCLTYCLTCCLFALLCMRLCVVCVGVPWVEEVIWRNDLCPVYSRNEHLFFARSVNSSKMLICHHAVKIRSPGIKSCFSPFSLPPFRNYLFLLPLRHYLLVDSFPTKGPYQATYPSDKPIHHRNILKMTSPSASIRSFRYDTPVVKGLTSLVPTSRGLKGEFSPLVR